MGYNNPAFVDDDNKSSNKGTEIRLNEKRTTTTNDVIHETTVNIVTASVYFIGFHIHTVSVR